MKDGGVPQSEIGLLNPANPPFLFVLHSAPFIFFYHYFSICYFHKASHHTHTSAALYTLISPAYSSALVSLQPSLHTSISLFHFHCLPLFLFRLAPHFSTFHFIPISLCLCFCVCVFVWQRGACGYFSGNSPEDWTVIIYGPEL